jgi:hypothetical protein
VLFVHPGPLGAKFATIILHCLSYAIVTTVALRIELSIIDRGRVFLCCHTTTRGNKEDVSDNNSIYNNWPLCGLYFKICASGGGGSFETGCGGGASPVTLPALNAPRLTVRSSYYERSAHDLEISRYKSRLILHKCLHHDYTCSSLQ